MAPAGSWSPQVSLILLPPDEKVSEPASEEAARPRIMAPSSCGAEAFPQIGPSAVEIWLLAVDLFDKQKAGDKSKHAKENGGPGEGRAPGLIRLRQDFSETRFPCKENAGGKAGVARREFGSADLPGDIKSAASSPGMET